MTPGRAFFMFLQLCGLLVAGSALPIGIIEADPTTQLTIMVAGMLIFWTATIAQGRLAR